MEFEGKKIRSVIYIKDIALITGKSIKSASRLYHKIKHDLGKDKQQILTIKEFCDYMGLKIEDILASINL